MSQYKLQSQHSAENLAGTQGKLAGKLDKNIFCTHVIGKQLLIGLAVGINDCVQVKGNSAHCYGCITYGSLAMAVY